ncbi:MAG TPA: chaperonin GroEL [Candidatus Saccharimonadales bacterium]|nr:chaperonin GroEL [Candidatus Saccharimonadales bacterium]
MAQPVKDNKILHYDKKVREALGDGSEEAYKAVTTTFGPKGLNVLIEKPYGRPILTRDGVTVAKEVYSSDRPKNMAMQLILEASQTTNRLAGDGTTATVALTHHLIKQGLELVAGGKNPMDLRDQLGKDSQLLLEALEGHTSEVSDGQLEQVATVSAGDPALGKLIAEAVQHVGQDGGIIAERAYISGVEREYIEGYYLQEGFSALTEGKKELENPVVIVSAKKISSNADFLELMEKTVKFTKEMPPRIAFVGEFEGQARESIIANIMQGKMDAVIIKTPSTGDMGTQYLDDIALYCGCRVIASGDSLKSFVETTPEGQLTSSFIGRAEKVICTPYTSSIFGGKHVGGDLEVRLSELTERIETEESDSLVEKFRDRKAKLQGKIAVFRIGGTTDTEREEKEFRIEDAIQATKAAMAEGVVPGGGTTLLRLSQTEGLSELTAKALQNVFKKLMENANLPADVKMHEVLNSNAPMGFNLRGEDKLVNLVEAGVLDPALVVQEVIKNASSNAGNALTIGCAIVFEDKKEDVK